MRLYELTEQYDGVMNLLYDGETDEQTILDTLESVSYTHLTLPTICSV